MKPRFNQRIQFSLAYVLVATLVFLLLQSWLFAPRTVEIPMSKFLELLRADKVERVALTEREIRGVARPDRRPPPAAAGAAGGAGGGAAGPRRRSRSAAPSTRSSTARSSRRRSPTSPAWTRPRRSSSRSWTS